jgi:hypothetical protein
MAFEKKQAPLNEPFVDNPDWNFLARSEQYDLDRTSATDFFNRKLFSNLI